MSILHYIHQSGYLPGIPQEFGGGQIVETEDDGTTVIDVRPMYTIASNPDPSQETMAEAPAGKTKQASKASKTDVSNEEPQA